MTTDGTPAGDLRRFSVEALHDLAAADGVDLTDPRAQAALAVAMARIMARVDQLSEHDRALHAAIVDDLLGRLDLTGDPVFDTAFKCALDIQMVVAKAHADRHDGGLSRDGYDALLRATAALADETPAGQA